MLCFGKENQFHPELGRRPRGGRAPPNSSGATKAKDFEEKFRQLLHPEDEARFRQPRGLGTETKREENGVFGRLGGHPPGVRRTDGVEKDAW